MILDPVILSFVKVFFPTVISFGVGLLVTPFLTHYLYKNKMWKKKVRTLTTDGRKAEIFSQLHKDKEIGTPKMGGVIIWVSAVVTVIIFWALSLVIDNQFAERLDFLSRNQTWLPLAMLIGGSLVGLLDDYMEVSEGNDYFAGGLSLKKRISAVFLISLVAGWWFYTKLGASSVVIPFDGMVELGIFFIPFFVLVTLAVYSGGVIDGIDGLSGGVFASIFSAYGIIAFAQDQLNLAALCFVIVGGILAFLWFNIPPARFYMAETGTMGLTITISVIAFLTQQVLVLPIIALPLVVTTLSDIIQLLSKKVRNKKVFLVAPIHHHFEALGWPSYKVTMRYWIFGVISAILGTCIALIG